VFGNRTLRRIFGLREREREGEREKVTGKWRKVHIEELYDLCSSPNIRLCEMRNVYKILFWNSEGKIPLRRSRRIKQDNIKVDFKVRVCECVWAT
jgi:hypothetical protein